VEGIRIAAGQIADGIALIDTFRAAGLEAHLADCAGTWDVEVVGAPEAVAAALAAPTRRWVDARPYCSWPTRRPARREPAAA